MQDNHLTDPRVREFVGALRRYEQDGDQALLGLFADDAVLSRFDGRGERGDVAGFWQEYRGGFAEVSTTFTAGTEGGDRAALEWTSDVVLPAGRPVTYRGVTVLDFDGERIAGMRAYYDSAALIAPPADTTA